MLQVCARYSPPGTTHLQATGRIGMCCMGALSTRKRKAKPGRFSRLSSGYSAGEAVFACGALLAASSIHTVFMLVNSRIP